MGGMGLGMVAEQLTDLKLSELLDTPPPGLDEAVAIAKVSCHTSCVWCRVCIYPAAWQRCCTHHPWDWTRLSLLPKSGEAVCMWHGVNATWPGSAAGDCRYPGKPLRLSLLLRAD